VVDLGVWQVLFLAVAGFVSGALNAAARGGSLVHLPALPVGGYPPLLGNLTNHLAAFPRYLRGALG